jgi:hypothetical protein
VIKYKDIEFSTIWSQDEIKNKLENILSTSSIFEKTNWGKIFSGNINLYNFEIHNKKSIFMYRAINYWKILIRGTMVNENNQTNVKMRIRIFHGEIVYMYLVLFVFSISFIVDGTKSIISIIILGIVFIIVIMYTIFKIKGIDNEIKHYERLIIKTIVE